MLKVTMTPNLLGFKIAGDYDDLNELYDAVWALSIADGDFPDDERMRGDDDELIMSTRLLALCYDIRHAYQGARNIEFVSSGMNEWSAKSQGLQLVEKNVSFSVEVLYPEAMYEALVLNYLVAKRANLFAGYSTYHLLLGDSEKVLFDENICVVRTYVAKLLSAVAREATAGRYSRIRKELGGEYHLIEGLYQQWVDVLNEEFVHMSRKQRAESLSVIVRDLAEYYRSVQYREMAADINRFADQNGVLRDDVRIPGLYEWDEPEW